MYVFAALLKFAFETPMRLQGEPASWGKTIQLLPLMVHEEVLKESQKVRTEPGSPL